MSLTMLITRGAELPDRTLAWEDSNGTPIDFTTTPHTFKLELLFPTPVTKTSGISGDAQGVVTIAFTAGETDTWPEGTFLGLLWAKRVSDNKDREPARITVYVL